MEWKLETETRSDSGNRNGNATSQLLYVGLRSSYTALLTWPNNIIQRISQGDRILRTDFTEIATDRKCQQYNYATLQSQQDSRVVGFHSQAFRAYMLPSVFDHMHVPKLSYIALWQCCVVALAGQMVQYSVLTQCIPYTCTRLGCDTLFQVLLQANVALLWSLVLATTMAGLQVP